MVSRHGKQVSEHTLGLPQPAPPFRSPPPLCLIYQPIKLRDGGNPARYTLQYQTLQVIRVTKYQVKYLAIQPFEKI